MDRNIQLFDTEEEALKRIEQLRDQGVLEHEMYLVVSEGEDISILGNCTEIIIDELLDTGVRNIRGSAFSDRFSSSIDDPARVEEAFYKMNISDKEREKVFEEVKEGKILLYLDQNYVRDYRDIRNQCTTDCTHGQPRYVPGASNIETAKKENTEN